MIIAGALSLVGAFGTPQIHQNVLLGSGATNFTPVQVPRTYLYGSGIGSSDTSIKLTSLKTTNGQTVGMSAFGDIGYATIDAAVPNKEENVSFTGITQNTDGTAILTGVTRGLLPFYPFTASSTYQVSHSGGASVIFSNSAPFYSQFAFWGSTTTITGPWTFASSAIPVFDTTSPSIFTLASQLVSKAYVDSQISAGAAPITTTTAGIGLLATMAQTASSTATGTYNGQTYNLIPQNKNFSAVGGVSQVVPVTNASGTLDSSFLGASTTYNIGGLTSASTTLNGSTNLNGTTTIGGSVLGFHLSTGNLFVASSTTFSSTGTVPSLPSVKKIYISANGSAGGNTASPNASGGAGSSITGVMPISTSTTYYVGVATGGTASAGAGGNGIWLGTSQTFSTSSILLVAAGGGGAGYPYGGSTSGGAGGAAGFPSGVAGTNGGGGSVGGGAGTQTAGGTAGGGNATAGSFGLGGNGDTTSYLYGGGGGGGYYGGGGGQSIANNPSSNSGAGGGGGSSFFSSIFTSTTTATTPATTTSLVIIPNEISATNSGRIEFLNANAFPFTVDFSVPFSVTPSCTLTPSTSTTSFVTLVSTSSFTFNVSSYVSGMVINYICL